jgi:hypothetical protein
MGLQGKYMKGLLGLATLILFATACAENKLETRCEPPVWFFETGTNNGIRTGVGEGANLDAATAAAMSEIGSQISTWVNSRTLALAERNGLSSESRFHHQVELESRHRLKNVRRLNMAVCGNRYYVKYAVDLRPSSAVMAETLADGYPGKNIRFTGSPALTRSSFAEALALYHADTPGYEDIKIPLELTFSEGIWWVCAGRVSIPVSDVSELVNLNVYATEGVDFGLCARNGMTRSTLLKTGDEVFFSIPEGEGVYSLFNVYQDGRVSVIAANQPLKKDKTLFPDPSGRCVLQASTLFPHAPSVDTYLLVLCPVPQDMSDFAALHEDGRPVAGDESFSAHILARWLDNIARKKVAILKTRTEPRYKA